MNSKGRNVDWKALLNHNKRTRATLAKAITAIENDTEHAKEIASTIYSLTGKAHVIGITGSPGVGKSTLVNAFVSELRKQEQTVGVIAVDPSSPLSGGAILGDRIRMSDHTGDNGVFVRSLASRGHLGGLSQATARVVDVMDAAGFDKIVIETVGTGQSEVEIMDIAQTVMVVCAPGLGDDIQAAKAGIMEIADILVVNKADMPHAERTVQQLRSALALTHCEGWQIPIQRTTSLSGEGMPELLEAVNSHADQLDPSHRDNAAQLRIRKLLANSVAERVRNRVEQQVNGDILTLCEEILRGETGMNDATEQAINMVAPTKNESVT